MKSFKEWLNEQDLNEMDINSAKKIIDLDRGIPSPKHLEIYPSGQLRGESMDFDNNFDDAAIKNINIEKVVKYEKLPYLREIIIWISQSDFDKIYSLPKLKKHRSNSF